MLQKTTILLKQEAANLKEASVTDQQFLAKRLKQEEKKVHTLEARVLDLEEEKIHLI